MNGKAHVLVVAGTDSSGGAGITRDVETVAAFGVHACVAVTAVTVQTHDAVLYVEPIRPELIVSQMRAALAANPVGAVKIGMLGSAGAIIAVAEVLRDHPRLQTILDPVLAASSGGSLLAGDTISVLKRELMPLCALITPNLNELAVLTGEALAQDEMAACQQGTMLLDAGCPALLVKGGHASGPQSSDILLRKDQSPLHLHAARLPGNMRGTGCMLASGIAASLARGETLETSVRIAKQYVFDRLASLAS